MQFEAEEPIDRSIERFEIAIARLVKGNQNGHDLSGTQPSLTLLLHHAIAQQVLLPLGFKLLAEIINVTKQDF